MLVEHLLLNLENKEDLEDLILQQEDDITPWNYEVTNENQDAASNLSYFPNSTANVTQSLCYM